MQKERISNSVYVFTSDLYAKVTACVILTSEGVVLFDTLAFPVETLKMKQFVEQRLKMPVRYIINSHFHADHTTGNCLFEDVTIISHRACRDLLNSRGRESLKRAQENDPELDDIRIILPHEVFDDHINLKIGNKVFELRASPGHSEDSIVCHLVDEQILFAADTVLPVPYFVDGSYNELLCSVQRLQNMNFDVIVQGHGEIILRGEIESRLQSDLDYLNTLSLLVNRALASENPDQLLKTIDIESCGKSRVVLNGLAEQLHQRNVTTLSDIRRRDNN